MPRINRPTWILFTAYVALWFIVAYFVDGTFSPAQMLQTYPGATKVMPVTVDLFIWADLIVLPFILGYIVQDNKDNYHQWTAFDKVAMGIIATVLTAIFHQYMILTGEWPAVLGWKGGHTYVGYAHFPFMVFALTIIGLHFFDPTSLARAEARFIRQIEPQVAITVGSGLLLQITLDFHVPLMFVQRWAQFGWYPDAFIQDPKQWLTLVAMYAATSLLTYLSGGWFAGYVVSGIAAFLWFIIEFG